MKPQLTAVVLIFVLWFALALILNAPVILPSPSVVFKSLLSILVNPVFLKDVLVTFCRGMLSFVIIVVAGTALGLLAGLKTSFEKFLSPFLSFIKATPVMSIILIAFFWFKSGTVPVFCSFLMAFPVMFVQTVTGVHSVDKKTEQMCTLYSITGKEKFRVFVWPSVLPFVLNGAKMSLSMIWKTTIAAEVLTSPACGIGSRMQRSQINLDTSYLLAWTVVAVLLTALCDFCFSRIIRKVANENK